MERYGDCWCGQLTADVFQWPDPIQVVRGGVTALPARVVAEAEGANVVCGLGLFPHVDLAWASVDSKFYLWKFGFSGWVTP